MERFSVSLIREQFETDVTTLMQGSFECAEQLLVEKNPDERHRLIQDLYRHGHSLRGLAGLVGAEALESWGQIIEFIAESQKDSAGSSDEKNQLLQHIIAQKETWPHLNQLSCDEKFTEANEIIAQWEKDEPTRLTTWRAAKFRNQAAVEQSSEREISAHVVSVPTPNLKRKETVDTAANAPTSTINEDQIAAAASPVSVPTPHLKRRTTPASAAALDEVLKDDVQMDLIEYFIEDAEEQIASLEKATLKWEKNEQPEEQSKVVRRAFHTLKGAANSVGLTTVGKSLHAAEDYIEAVSNNEKKTSPGLFQFLLNSSDHLRSLLTGLKSSGKARWPYDWLGTLNAIAQAPATEKKPVAPPPTSPVQQASVPQVPTPALKRIDTSAAPEPVAPVAPPTAPATASTPAKAKEKPADALADEINHELLPYFIDDAEEQLVSLERASLRWEQQDAVPEQILSVRRAFHTLKGAANSVGLTTVGKNFHAAESFIEAVNEGTKPTSLALFQFLFKSIDQLRHLLAGLKKDGYARWPHDWSTDLKSLESEEALVEIDESLTALPDEPAAETVERTTIRVDAERVSRLANLLSEIVIDRRRLENRTSELAHLRSELQERNQLLANTIATFQREFEFNLLRERANASTAPLSGEPTSAAPSSALHEFTEVEFDRYDQFSILARSLVEIANDFDQLLNTYDETIKSLDGEANVFKQTSKNIQNIVSDLSLVAFNELVPRLQRAFRDALVAEEKEADFEIIGAETRLDKALIEKVYPPLLHLIRNGVAHGLENPDAREAAGKPRRGRIRLTCAQASNQVIIHLEDDGRGLDFSAILKRAIERQLLPANTDKITLEQARRLICQAGFSTATEVSEISGRGVGMDVVRTEIENLKGALDLRTQEGQGTEWTIRLPLTLTISEGVVLETGHQRFALPLSFIESAFILTEKPVTDAQGQKVYPLPNGELIPWIALHESLGTAVPDSVITRGLIISAVGQRALLAVDQILGRYELAMKPLDPLTALHPLINSASIDADGRIIPVLNTSALLDHRVRPKFAHEAEPTTNVTKRERLSILVVDDSLSVRKAQERMLTDLGCEVILANDGLQGLERLRERDYDLVLTDLEMPLLNGYELIAEIRSHPTWRNYPVVVISSRSADKYVAKAMNLGATSFLFKPFTAEQIADVLKHYVTAG